MIEFLWKCNVNPQIRKLQYSDIGGVYDLGMKVQEFSAKAQQFNDFMLKAYLPSNIQNFGLPRMQKSYLHRSKKPVRVPSPHVGSKLVKTR